ncbi:Hypothetical Protein FCC1311_100822 [Hondaea fermentalgiana]|uniref:Uncharacterized protein n=1 Tax=Hondaea fermentalgiana TaxID=2315210 RepID=A0A2R5GU60_9STRA|nr:Hypothetical Protein FCC1311_100822 [Hondaea fermentalgiana]|eukprot:GBG33859.1 Hypothetical Protein FCC1311_100822 [Hondaea fermentalgiana]
MSGRDAGETGAGKADGPEATPRGQTFVQELVPRRRDATSHVRRRARPGRERRRAKPRTLQGEIEDDLDVSLAESAVKSSRDNIVFDNDDDDMQGRDDDDDDDDDDVHDDFFRDDEEQDEQDEDIASESDDDAPTKERLTCLDIVHNLASVLVDEYAEELEQRGRPEYAVFLDRFLAEIRSEFAVYNTLAHEFASHSRFSRALTRELQDLREKLAWMQKQRIRAERLVSAKRAELAHREASKKEADAASAYLARLQPSSQRR